MVRLLFSLDECLEGDEHFNLAILAINYIKFYQMFNHLSEAFIAYKKSGFHEKAERISRFSHPHLEYDFYLLKHVDEDETFRGTAIDTLEKYLGKYE